MLYLGLQFRQSWVSTRTVKFMRPRSRGITELHLLVALLLHLLHLQEMTALVYLCREIVLESSSSVHHRTKAAWQNRLEG